ncbi:MAG: Trm112 family protein [Acidobacteriota bacterium]
MAISKELLEILACPQCKKEVRLTSDGKGLKCSQCHRVYPIQDDIPIMLVDEAVFDDPPDDT